MKKVIISIFIISACFLTNGVFASGTVEINTASLAQLDTLTGIGPKYAQAIIGARPFSSIDDLLKVKGIGPKTLQKIKDQGLAYVSGQISQNTQEPAATVTVAPTPTISLQPAVAPVINYPAGVAINEILPNPTGSDEEDEWIELHNTNSFEVDLNGWQIQDTKGTPKTYTIKDTKILADGFLILKRPDTKIMLNNDEDGLNLLTPDAKITDSVSFSAAPLGQSYNKISASWRWSTTPTPGNKNIITQKEDTKSSNILSKAKNSVKNDGVALGLADISQNINKNQDLSETKNPWFLFFTVLATTIILATILLFIKLKISKKHVRT